MSDQPSNESSNRLEQFGAWWKAHVGPRYAVGYAHHADVRPYFWTKRGVLKFLRLMNRSGALAGLENAMPCWRWDGSTWERIA